MMMSSGPSGVFLLFIMFQIGVPASGSIAWRRYSYIRLHYTWSQAQAYCRNSGLYNDLATIYTPSDLNNMDMTRYAAWIDLRNPNVDDDSTSRWDWVWAGQYRNNLIGKWAYNEPDDGETWKWSTGLSDYADEGWHQNIDGSCASISSRSKLMVPQNCEDRFPFICYKDNLILIKENKTWEEALEYCMIVGYKLVSVQPGADHANMMSMIEYEGGTEKVWTGLRFLAGHWVFTNRVTVSYSDLPLCPVEEQHCGAFLRDDTAGIHPTNCLEKWNFLCYY
ncbi:hypothetical protein D5F01_LYC04234 [Larimichthys crocea]|uniref:C-type lectin domain-containing protein n=1 Tax=Larimichthys crocea TaxID=215358 RepID=A0A6G0J288_LARCR|nr:hypothetical protein D5F01_LYC04234 [Larimichthys crocea]